MYMIRLEYIIQTNQQIMSTVEPESDRESLDEVFSGTSMETLENELHRFTYYRKRNNFD